MLKTDLPVPTSELKGCQKQETKAGEGGGEVEEGRMIYSVSPATKESHGRYRRGSGVDWLTIRLAGEM